jgi:polysaccharide export outer membrane protein
MNHRTSLSIHGFFTATLFLILWAVTGCQTPSSPGDFPAAPGAPAAKGSEATKLHEGDVVRIAFPGTPSLNAAAHQIRPDGTIQLPLIGEVKVIGMTPAELEADLVKRYASQLVSKEVTVTVESSSFAVYVTGSVLHPGKISSNRQLSALDAIMEAGGFDDTRANKKAVKIIRHEGTKTTNYTVNLKKELEGTAGATFYLQPLDTVYVPERFRWF